MPVRTTQTVRHPGRIIEDWLGRHGHRQVWLAERLPGARPNSTTQGRAKHLNQVIRGHAKFSVAWALAVESATGLSARDLMHDLVDWEIDQERRRRSLPSYVDSPWQVGPQLKAGDGDG